MSDTVEHLSASQHAQLLIAEAHRVFAATAADDENAMKATSGFLGDACVAAVESGRVDEVVNMLACAVVAAWTVYAQSIEVPVASVLKTVLDGWSDAESGWRDAGLPAAQ